MVVVAVDAMGGDNAPKIAVDGLKETASKIPKCNFLFYGKERLIAPLIPKALSHRVEVVNVDEVIAADAKVSRLVRSALKSSMGKAIGAVKNNKADVAVSAGNTAMLMAASKLALGTVQGLERPALASFMPHLKGEFLALDLGANVDCSAEQLVQFALMGSLFCKLVTGLESPRVALLNVGSEELKGSKVVQEAAQMLRTSKINFTGFVEADALIEGLADVVVSDGFVGNVMLKSAEGCANLISKFLKRALKSSPTNILAAYLLAPTLKRLKKRIDPRHYSGAVLLGTKKLVIKSHGSSDALAFAKALELAENMVANGFNDEILGVLKVH